MASGSRRSLLSIPSSSNPPDNSAQPPSSTVSKAIAQLSVDARLNAAFEQSAGGGAGFLEDSQSILAPSSFSSSFLSSSEHHHIAAYLSKIQRSGHIQPFGCTLAVDEPSFRIIAFSANASDLLDLNHQSVPSLDDDGVKKSEPLAIGTDVRSLFTAPGSALLERAANAREITLLNPLWVHSRKSGKPFLAILHRIDVGIVIDLEPARTEDPTLSIAGAVQSQKLAVRAISSLQALPGGDVNLLCGTVVRHVQELTGYDRVMVYKFHADEHGEVIAESKRDDLEPYLSLHYPARDSLKPLGFCSSRIGLG